MLSEECRPDVRVDGGGMQIPPQPKMAVIPAPAPGLLQARLKVMERAFYLLMVELELDGLGKEITAERPRLAFAMNNAWAVLRDELRATVRA